MGSSLHQFLVRGSPMRLRSVFVLIVLSVAVVTGLSLSQLSAQQPVTLTVRVDQPGVKIDPLFYGLMTEEINFSYDGGLYAEMIRNRTFRSDWTGVNNWFVVEKGTGSAKITADAKEGPSTALPNSGKLEVVKADANNPAGVLNE